MAGKKVVVVLGSPRAKGNSTTLGLRVAQGVKKAGGSADVVRLHEMDLRPCRACDACRKKMNYTCVQNDRMRDVYPLLRQADAVVIASPVYWFTMAAQTKIFMDRLYAFTGAEGWGLKGKQIGIVLTYQDADPFGSGAVNALRAFQDAFAFMEAPIAGMVYGSADKPGDILRNKAVLKQAYELGVSLAKA